MRIRRLFRRLNSLRKIGGYNLAICHIIDRIMGQKKVPTIIYSILEKADKGQYESLLTNLYTYYTGDDICFTNPRAFTEKIQYSKLYESTIEKGMLADKYAVRDWVKQEVGEEFLVPLLGVWDNTADIDFKDLPDKYVLKCNHGSGYNIIVSGTKGIDIPLITKKLDSFLQEEYAFKTGLELHYKSIQRKIICESYIEELDGNLYDYKFHCFNGKPLFVQCIGDRDLEKHTGKQNNFDMKWEKLDWIFEDYPPFDREVSKPVHFEKMIEVARRLSKGFKYVRVDLYDLPSGVLFGEMTFTPGSGFYSYKGTWTRERDLEVGSLIDNTY